MKLTDDWIAEADDVLQRPAEVDHSEAAALAAGIGDALLMARDALLAGKSDKGFMDLARERAKRLLAWMEGRV